MARTRTLAVVFSFVAGVAGLPYNTSRMPPPVRRLSASGVGLPAVW